jgi:hypothetical protein
MIGTKESEELCGFAEERYCDEGCLEGEEEEDGECLAFVYRTGI